MIDRYIVLAHSCVSGYKLVILLPNEEVCDPKSYCYTIIHMQKIERKEKGYWGIPVASIRLPATEKDTVKFCPTLLWNDKLEPEKGIVSNWAPCPTS